VQFAAAAERKLVLMSHGLERPRLQGVQLQVRKICSDHRVITEQ
jgi:hypothetical protein